MNTAGTITKIAAIFLFMLFVPAVPAYCLFRIIFAIYFSCTGNAWQQEKVKAEDEHDYFHRAKINTIAWLL